MFIGIPEIGLWEIFIPEIRMSNIGSFLSVGKMLFDSGGNLLQDCNGVNLFYN